LWKVPGKGKRNPNRSINKIIVPLIDKIKLKWIYILSAIFIVLNVAFMINEFYWFSLLPVLFLLIILFFFALDRLLLFIVFLTPFAININDFDSNLGLSLPTEPLLFGVLCLFFIKLLFDRHLLPARLFKHPVTIAILFYLLWMFITSLTSELPLVSFKYLLSRLWFIVPFYFMMVLVFRKIRFIKTFTWLYVVSLIAIIFFSTYNLITWGFSENAAHWVMSPFYNDHTAYGAAISFFIPILFGMLFIKRYSQTEKIILGVAFAILMMGLVLSYSRAAWISVFAAFGVAMVFILKIRLRWIVIILLAVVGFFYVFEQQIFMKMEKNKQDASVNLAEHVQSISNISSDASNLERMNRWNAAFRMFEQRPFLGWGPGTYQFVYAPFQLSKDKTIISTNAGDKGTAHSEFIGPLTEEGVIGLLSVLGILGAIIWTMVRIWKRSKNPEIRALALMFFLGLVTYYTHGILNNFLDTDKASVPFWGFIAVLVSLDLYQQKNSAEEENQPAESLSK
jgi:putative inorganic carbon (HCO3(-)) transporter